MTLKYLRDLTDESLKSIYEHNCLWRYKWFDLYENNHKNGIRDEFVNRQLDMYIKSCNKIEKVMKERNLI